MRIAIYGSKRQELFLDDISTLLRSIAERGDDIIMHSKLYAYLSEANATISLDGVEHTDSADFSADLALSIGGDGTFLRTAQWVADKEIPIVGVNTGHLGFLAPFSIGEAIAALHDNCLANYKIIDRCLLRLDYPFGEINTWPYALNEVAFMKRDSASMIGADVRVDRLQLANYLCDGLIVATPTGSTGYNLSVGGPIVQPGLHNMILSPIAAHSLSMRPLVLDGNGVLEVKVTSRTSSYRISLDGRSLTMPCGASVFLSRAPFVIRTVQKPDYNFFATLRDKLLWGASPMSKKLSE